MTTQSNAPKNALNALLTPEDSVLVLIDHQPFQFANLHSHEPTMVVNNVVALAKTAKIFGVPTILTTVLEDRGGKLIKGLQDVFPDQKPIDRTFINTWEDQRVVDAVKKTGRKKIIMAALWSEICLAMPAIQAAGEGYEVYAVTDASGGVSAEAHDMAVRRMAMAGVVPITWMAVAGELQRDWAREETAKMSGEMFLEHGGGTGIALAWELQLLGQKAAAERERPSHLTRSAPPNPSEHVMITSNASEAAKAVVRRNTEEVQGGGNFAVFEELFADDFLDHTPQPGRTPDKAGARELYKVLRAAFPDFHAEIHWQLADSDRVTTYKTYHGTHLGEFFGVAPTGRKIQFETVDVMRVRDGQIAEHWGVANLFSLMQQLGVSPAIQNRS
jgi:steroid delta-isomerase-like uncharacterized protein